MVPKQIAPLHIAIATNNYHLCENIIKKTSKKNPTGGLEFSFRPWNHPAKFSLEMNFFQPDTKITPLHMAALNGDIEICKLVMQNTNELNPRTNFGTTPLLIAATNGHLNVYTLIAEKVEDKNPADNLGKDL